MSKLDQIKALGAAKAASRNSSDGGVESENTRPDLGSQAKEHPAEGRTITSDSVATQREFRRPLARDRHKTVTANKPWEAEGMSRASWYRRQRAKEQKT